MEANEQNPVTERSWYVLKVHGLIPGVPGYGGAMWLNECKFLFLTEDEVVNHKFFSHYAEPILNKKAVITVIQLFADGTKRDKYGLANIVKETLKSKGSM